MWNPFKTLKKSLKERDEILAKQESEELINLREVTLDGKKIIAITVYGLPVTGGDADDMEDLVKRLIELRKRYIEFRSYMK